MKKTLFNYFEMLDSFVKILFEKKKNLKKFAWGKLVQLFIYLILHFGE